MYNVRSVHDEAVEEEDRVAGKKPCFLFIFFYSGVFFSKATLALNVRILTKKA
jgi:hypothetical protein